MFFTNMLSIVQLALECFVIQGKCHYYTYTGISRIDGMSFLPLLTQHRVLDSSESGT